MNPSLTVIVGSTGFLVCVLLALGIVVFQLHRTSRVIARARAISAAAPGKPDDPDLWMTGVDDLDWA